MVSGMEEGVEGEEFKLLSWCCYLAVWDTEPLCRSVSFWGEKAREFVFFEFVFVF